MTRILLSEGSSLSARETITALGLAGHRVELVGNDCVCLGRWSRFVSAFHRAPTAGSDPSAYLQAVLKVIKDRKIDVLLPVHEQAYLFAAKRSLIPANVGLALASFQSFEEVQSKKRFAALLSRLGVPQPQTDVWPLAKLDDASPPYPFYVKTVFGTASEGVWHVQDASQKRSVVAELAQKGAKEALVQSDSGSRLERAQTVFDHGRLVAFHIYRQLAEGPRGGDVLKESVVRPDAIAHIEKIGAALAWHGALALDYLLEDGTDKPLFIDANPRIVEPVNALLSGVDLAGALLDVSLGKSPPRQDPGKAGVVTKLTMMGLLDAASRRGLRRDVIREMFLSMFRRGRYRGAAEELTPFRFDPLSGLPIAFVVLQLLISPRAWVRITGNTIRNYSLTPEAIGRLQDWNTENPERTPSLAVPEPLPV